MSDLVFKENGMRNVLANQNKNTYQITYINDQTSTISAHYDELSQFKARVANHEAKGTVNLT